MSIKVECPLCRARMSFADELAEQRGQCPRCKNVLIVPPPTAAFVPSGAEEPEGAPCPSCRAPVALSAAKCRHCGEWLSQPKDRPGSGLLGKGSVDARAVAHGIKRAQQDELTRKAEATFLTIGCVALAIIVAWMAESWFAGVGTLAVSIPVAVILSVIWERRGYWKE